MLNLLLKYPSRSRPALFKQIVTQWTSTAAHPERLHWLCSFDSDDPTMCTEDIKTFCQQQGIEACYGTSANKIAAVNRDVERTTFDWDVLVDVADDYEPQRKGWDEYLDQHVSRSSALWPYDGRQKRVNTLPILGRDVYTNVLGGHIYDPRFVSVYADNYQTDLLQRAGALLFVDEPVFAHRWGVNNNDALMKRNEDRRTYTADEATYKALGGSEATMLV